jgi:hypothetical protein
MTGISHDYEPPALAWVQLRNEWARDTRLDWGALGLLTYLTSHRDGFEVELARLTTSRSSKRHKVMAWIAELEKHGYVERETKRDRGVVVGTTWHLLGPDVGQQHQL